MDLNDLQNMTRRQLLALAKEAGIPRRSRMTKGELIAALPVVVQARPAELGLPEELPNCYGQTRLTLLEIEPRRIFAYWEIIPQDRSAAMQRAGSTGRTAPWILRFYQITHDVGADISGCAFFDVAVELDAGNWYVHLDQGGKSLMAEAGISVDGGCFLAVCRSNAIFIPGEDAHAGDQPLWVRVESVRARPEEVPEPPWMPVPEPFRSELGRDVALHGSDVQETEISGPRTCPGSCPL